MSENDASTLLADIIENAIIATNSSNATSEKRIFVEIGTFENIFYIRISDNGIPFPPEVLNNWGIKRITTHKDTGGSGIGMMSVYEICKRYNASFRLESFPENHLYSKRISIIFDGKNSFESTKTIH